MGKPPDKAQFLPNLSKDTLAFSVITLIRNTLMRSASQFIEDIYFYPPEDPDDRLQNGYG